MSPDRLKAIKDRFSGYQEVLDSLGRRLCYFPPDLDVLELVDEVERLETYEAKFKMERSFLSMDSSFHWYLVPYSRRAEWDLWNALDDNDEAGWVAPDYAKRLNGSPSRVTFTEPMEML